MGASCSCVEDKACCCKSNVTECLQRSAQERRERRCNCTSRRPKYLKIRRKCICNENKKKVSFCNCTCQPDCPQATVYCTSNSDEESCYCSKPPSPATVDICTETMECPRTPEGSCSATGKPGTVKNVCRFTVDAYFT